MPPLPDFLPFQSTFPRGERRDSFNTAYNSTNFNPRSRVGNDVATFLPLYLIQISIHVPAWGTTMEELLHTRHFHISIHVPAWGTTQFAEQNINHFQFQSTFPRGERHFIHRKCLRNGKFQSTFPRGERHCSATTDNEGDVISIHVPAWGTTVWNSTCPKRTPISIHVPAWGTTKKEIDGLIFVEISIHVPAWGTTGADC